MRTNDTFAFPKQNTERRYVLELHGVFGGATATIGYIDPSGGFVSFKRPNGVDPASTIGSEGWVVETPKSGQFAVQTTGATGSTAIKLAISEAAL